MTIQAGARLGPYVIVAPLGAGGMGEVYRARDTRLDRTVAIKVLPPDLAADPQLRDRFDREARAISALNHPHICALYDIGRESDVDFLVLEYLDGDTLADRLAKGALPIADALRYAIEICDAIARAHRAGIVHRDLKPANVMVTKGGAKLLDFGLAKPAAPVVATGALSMRPTTPATLTAHGTILGTFQYMAPEQIEGLEADARTDIFAFGALLFEMITGRPAFDGQTRASLLGAILKDTPPRVSSLQPAAPPALDRLVATCLDKDPEDRYQSARDLLRDLQWIATTSERDRAHATEGQAPRRRRIGRLAVAAAALLVAGAAAGALLVRNLRPVTGIDSIQFTVAPPDGRVLGGPPGGGTGQATQLALSPDGRQLAFVAADRESYMLWVRPASATSSRLLPGTEGAAFPFWSPDGRYVGFFAEGKLKKVAVSGGSPLVLCDAPTARGGTWNRDNVIVFSPATTGPLQRVSSAGGAPTDVTALDAKYGETSHRWPFFLPDGRHFLFTASVGICCPAAKLADIRVGSLDSRNYETLLQVDSSAIYASEHLLFARGGTLMAAPFDAAARKLTGDAFPIAERINSENSRYASFSASATGVLAYAHGGSQVTTRLVWRDRSGAMLGTVGEPALYFGLALSRDERRIAVSLPSGADGANTPVPGRDIWIIDAVRGSTSRVTFDQGADAFPVWSPDGTRVAYQATKAGTAVLRQKAVDATAPAEAFGDERRGAPTDWSADGRFLLFNRTTAATTEVWALSLTGDKKEFPVAVSRFFETNAVLAPDGHWIAYASNETGRFEIYLQRFPSGGEKYPISTNGGAAATWRGDGKELFFLAPDSRLMAVSIDTTRGVEIGTPQPLFGTEVATINGRQYAASKDGKRFLINTRERRPAAEPIAVVVNWLTAIQK